MSASSNPGVYIADLAMMDNAALKRFVEGKRAPDGSVELNLADWENMPLHLFLRLRNRALGVEMPSDALPMFAELPGSEYMGDCRCGSPRFGAKVLGEVEPSPGGRERFLEIEAYHDIVKANGRPVYSNTLISDVFRDPKRYRHMIEPFLFRPLSTDTTGHHVVLQNQLVRWQNFRKWQLDNRGLDDPDDKIGAFLDRATIKHIRNGSINMVAAMEYHPCCLEAVWAQETLKRQQLRLSQREIPRNHNFEEYAQAVNRRLARHGFVCARPFQLRHDVQNQDKLSTWIEYLNFEYWWFDVHKNHLAQMQLEFERAWRELVNAKVLWESETAEFFHTKEGRRQLVHERQDMEIQLAYKVRLKSSPVIRRLYTAARALERRHRCIFKFFSKTARYFSVKRDFERQGAITQWALSQIPLIMLEEAGAAGEATQPAEPARVMTGMTITVGGVAEQLIRRWSRGNEEDNRSQGDNGENRPRKRQKRGTTKRTSLGKPSQPIRRSSRIANLQESAC